MTATPATVEARVRNACNTYTAHAAGKCASCTAGPEHAVKALAHKVFTDQPARVEFVRREGHQLEIWRIAGAA